MKIHIKNPFLTDVEKRAQDWVLRTKPAKTPASKNGKGPNMDAVRNQENLDEGS